MADVASWKDVAIEFVKGLPQTIVASGATAGIFYKWIAKMRKDAAEDRRRRDKNLRDLKTQTKRIESKVNGNHKITMKAIRAQGKLEGVMKGKKEAHEEIEHVTKVLAKATKRGSRRSTDK